MNFEHGRSTTVLTDKGYVRGFKHNGIYHFWGMEYAYADRWEVPREVEPWEGVKEATNYGYICPPMQANRLGNHIKNPYRYWPMGDHCQNLNVWTRDLDPTKKKPVVFWCFGGGFFDGSAIEHQAYDGFNLAKKDDIVVVTMNHRLNVLGFLDLSSFGEQYKRTKNLGMLDIVKALEWVKRNIAKFGGDPDNVTIFGQSGGGAKVNTLLNMPAAEGLFHKAMIMSGSYDKKGVDNTILDHRPIVLKALENMGLTENDLDQLKTMNSQELCKYINGAAKELGIKFQYNPMPDEDFLGDPTVYGFSEFAKKVPVINGGVFAEFNYQFWTDYRESDTSDEEAKKLIDKRWGEGKGERLAPLFKKAFPELKLVDLLNYHYDGHRDGSKYFCNRRLKDGCSAPTWNYLFAPLTGINERSTPVHSYEIPFFFHNSELIPSNSLIGQDATELVELQCSQRLVNFARYGTPDLPGQEKWLPVSEGHLPCLIIDRNTRCVDNFDEEMVAIIREGIGEEKNKLDDLLKFPTK